MSDLRRTNDLLQNELQGWRRGPTSAGRVLTVEPCVMDHRCWNKSLQYGGEPAGVPRLKQELGARRDSQCRASTRSAIDAEVWGCIILLRQVEEVHSG